MSRVEPPVDLKTTYSDFITLNSEPYIGYVDEIVSDEEASHIIEIAQGMIKRAKVSSDGAGVLSKGRTGGNCWLPHNTSDTISAVANRIAQLLGLPLSNAESLQVIHYLPGQQYKAHYDGYDLDTSKGQRCCKFGGQRLLTSIVYLNNVESGGDTSFPKAGSDSQGLQIPARKGRMAVFHNCETDSNKVHPESLHAGMPVIKGEKWAFNIWFRERPMSEEQSYPELPKNSASTGISVSDQESNRLLGDSSSAYEHPTIKESGPASITFGPGHYVPYFCLQNQDDKLREIQLYAGGYTVLMLLPDNLDTVRNALEARKKVRRDLQAENIQTVCIVQGSVGRCKELHSEAKATISLWADTTGAVGKFLGKKISIKTTLILTDPNLKTLLVADDTPVLETLSNFAYEVNVEKETSIISGGHAPVMLIPNALSLSTCNRLIECWKNGQQFEGTVGVGSDRAVKSATKIRTDVSISDHSLLNDLDYELSLSTFPELKKIGDFTVSHRERYKIGCYLGEKKGHFRQHRDTSTLSLANRRYSISIGLSENYEGGGLVFSEYEDRPYKLPKGSAIVFPSILFHKVEPVTKGERFVLVSFLYDEAGALFRSENRLNTGFKDDTESNRLLKSPDTSQLKISRVYTQSLPAKTVNQEAPSLIPSDSEPDLNVKVAFIEKAISQGLLSKARSVVSNLQELSEKQRLSNKILEAVNSQKNLYIQVAGDSLALPRPDRLKEFDADANPFLSTTLYETYPMLLEEGLQDIFRDKRVRVDTSICERSFRITNLTARLPDIFSYRSPNVVIIQVGIVDCWMRGVNLDQQDVPIEIYESEFQKLFSYRKKACPDTPIIIVGLCPTDPSLYKRNNNMNAIIKDYNKVLNRLVQQEKHAMFLNPESFINPQAPYEHLHMDGIHLSTSGHKTFSNELLQKVIQLIGDRQ